MRTGLAQLPESTRGWIHKAGNDGFIKLVEDAARGVLVGATSMGPLGRRGARLAWSSPCTPRCRPSGSGSMIYAYPTFHRAIEAALRDLARGA